MMVFVLIERERPQSMTRVTLCVAVLAQRATMPISFPVRD